MSAGRGLVPTDNDAAGPGGADMHLFRMSAISRRDGSSPPTGSPTGPGSRATRPAIRLDDRRRHKPMPVPPALCWILNPADWRAEGDSMSLDKLR
jgi:hypothetical protein